MLNHFVVERFVLQISNTRVHGVRFAPEQYSPALFDQAQVPLPPAIARSVAKRQAEFLAGRLASQSALAEQGFDQRVGLAESRAPMWPEGVHGSISHSADVALSVVCAAQDGALGIDLEGLLDIQQAEQLWPGIVNPEEALRLRATGDFARQLTLVFSAKESLFKALYPRVGRYFDFLDAEAMAFNPQRHQLELVLRQPLSADFPAGRRFRLHWRRLGDKLLTLLIC